MGRRSNLWFADGIARLDSVDDFKPDERFVTAGLPVEFVWTTRTRSFIGLELRLAVNLNPEDTLGTLTLGFAVGDLN